MDGEFNVGTKITRPRDGRHKNNSPKGWTDGDLNGWHKNNLQKGWTKGELPQTETYLILRLS